MSMQITDAQVHVWAADRPDRPWITGGAEYAHRGATGVLSADELLGEMDSAGVSRALLVSPTWEGNRNDLVLEEAARHPDRLGVIVRFDLDKPDEEQLVAWHADPRVFGARAVFIKHTAEWLEQGVADWVWRTAEDIGMPLMIYAPYQYDGVRRVAERHPDLKIAICHLGMLTSLRDEEIVSEVAKVIELAELPNVAVKASSLPSFVTEDYPYPSLHGHIERVVEAYGPERVFWGSDLSRLRGTYQQLVDLFMKELDFLSDDDRRLIMGNALAAWFNWPTT
jgi:L-fuconolactonase